MQYLIYLFYLYFFLIAFLYFYQDKLIFFPDTLKDSYAFLEFPDAEELYFYPEDGVRIHALHFKVPQSKGVILYFHGNARALDQWGYMAEKFTRLGYDVMMPDYRGFGKSQGPRNETNMINDAQFIYEELLDSYDEKEIVIYGRSMGSGVATALATLTNPKLLILETPYHSIYRMARESAMGYFPVSFILKYHFRSDLRLPNVHVPVYLFHGTMDELIPYQHAVDLQATNPASTLITIPKGLHNTLSDFEQFRMELKRILK